MPKPDIAKALWAIYEDEATTPSQKLRALEVLQRMEGEGRQGGGSVDAAEGGEADPMDDLDELSQARARRAG